jgi:hypothetical protein
VLMLIFKSPLPCIVGPCIAVVALFVNLKNNLISEHGN